MARSFAVGAATLDPRQLAWWTTREVDTGKAADDTFLSRRWIAAGDEVAFDGTTLLAAPPGEDPLAQVNAVIGYRRSVAIGCALIAVGAVAAIVR